jgi:hypothetical protein
MLTGSFNALKCSSALQHARSRCPRHNSSLLTWPRSSKHTGALRQSDISNRYQECFTTLISRPSCCDFQI